MGYSTNFTGRFQFDRKPDSAVVEQIKRLADWKPTEDRSHPDSYCQWALTKELDGICWDGGEKFYFYVEWLQWIIDNILKPNSILLSGRVEFQGDDVQDHGFIILADDQQVRTETVPEVMEEFEELRRFKDYVLTSEWKDEITEGWREHNHK